MSFNVEKCHIIHLEANIQKERYFMDGKALVVSEQERDVGIIISLDLKPEKQCKLAAVITNGVLSQILRYFHYRDKQKNYVRPHLKYAVTSWCP